MEKTYRTIDTSASTERIINAVKKCYVGIILGVLGVFALVTAVLVSYPAIAYLASKLF